MAKTIEETEQHFVRALSTRLMHLMMDEEIADGKFETAHKAMLRALLDLAAGHGSLGNKPVSKDVFLTMCAELWDAAQPKAAMARKLAAHMLGDEPETEH